MSSRMRSLLKDAQRLWSSIRHEEGFVNKNRRLGESYVRSDDVSAQAVRLYVERSYQPSNHSESLHEVQNYMVFSDLCILQNYFSEPKNLGNIYSFLDLLSDKALHLLANLVTEGKIKFGRTRRNMKEIIKSIFPAENDKALAEFFKQLTEHLQSPVNSHEEQINNINTICTSSLSSSIQKGLESLDSLPIFALSVVSKKLNCTKTVLRFPPSSSGHNKKAFVNKIKRTFHEINLIYADFIPERFLKALSVIHLYLKYKTRCSDPVIENLFSFSVKTVITQNEVLKSLWLLPKVTSNQTEALQSAFGLKLGHHTSGFLNDMKLYLMQYLFECDEIDIPRDISNALCIINQNCCNQPQIEEEIEAALNVSIELRLMASAGIDDTGMGSDDDTMSNDFELTEKGYSVNLLKCRQQQKKDLSLSAELDFIGDSKHGTCYVSSNFDSCSDSLLSKIPKSLRN